MTLSTASRTFALAQSSTPAYARLTEGLVLADARNRNCTSVLVNQHTDDLREKPGSPGADHVGLPVRAGSADSSRR